MELLFVALGGAFIGLAARYALPRRRTHGSMLVPVIGVLAASVLWVGLTWLGLPWDGGWIWAISLLGSAAVTAATGWLIGVRREHADAAFLENALRAGTATA